jgi:hypothetical protein
MTTHYERSTSYHAVIVGRLWMPNCGALNDAITVDEAREIERGALPSNPSADDVRSFIEINHGGDFSAILGVEITRKRVRRWTTTNADQRIVKTTTRKEYAEIMALDAEAEEIRDNIYSAQWEDEERTA